jgi:hypothetical protein
MDNDILPDMGGMSARFSLNGKNALFAVSDEGGQLGPLSLAHRQL